MFTVTEELDIARPPEEVFDFLADLRGEPTWNPLITSATLISGEPIGVGSKFDVVRKGSGMSHVQLTGFDRPGKLTYLGQFRGGQYTYTGSLTPSGLGTHLDERLDMELHGLMKLMTPMIRRRLTTEVAETARLMKAAMEAQTEAASLST